MKLKTSLGYEYTVNFVDGPTITSGVVVISMHDDRRLPKIAEEFDELEYLERLGDVREYKRWEGYSNLQRIVRMGDGSVQIALSKE